jgi:hypothetical protein
MVCLTFSLPFGTFCTSVAVTLELLTLLRLLTLLTLLKLKPAVSGGVIGGLE